MIKKHRASFKREEVSRAVQLLSKLYLSSVPCFLENKSHAPNLFTKDVNSISTFKLLHGFSLRVHKFLKNYILKYRSSGSLLKRPGESVCSGKPFTAEKRSILRAFHAFTDIYRRKVSTAPAACWVFET